MWTLELAKYITVFFKNAEEMNSPETVLCIAIWSSKRGIKFGLLGYDAVYLCTEYQGLGGGCRSLRNVCIHRPDYKLVPYKIYHLNTDIWYLKIVWCNPKFWHRCHICDSLTQTLLLRIYEWFRSTSVLNCTRTSSNSAIIDIKVTDREIFRAHCGHAVKLHS